MKKKRLLIIILSILGLALLTFGGYKLYLINQEKRAEAKIIAFENVTVEAKEEYKDTIELTSESNKINVLDMVDLKSSNEETDLSKFTLKPVDYETIDTSNSGNYGVKLIATTTDSYGEEATKEYTINFKVADTIKPEIKIKEETIILDYGTSYDSSTNIESITDNIDGDLEKVDNLEKGKASYTVTTKLDTSTAGDYTVTINAKDSANNKEKATFTVTVKEKVVVQQRPTTSNKSNNNTTVSNNTNSGNYSSNNNSSSSANTSSGDSSSSSTSTPTETPSNNNSNESCDYAHELGNSGFVGTYDEATAYANQKLQEQDKDGWLVYKKAQVQLYHYCRVNGSFTEELYTVVLTQR